MKNYWLDRNKACEKRWKRLELRGANCSLIFADESHLSPPPDHPMWDFKSALEETILEKYGPNWKLIDIGHVCNRDVGEK